MKKIILLVNLCLSNLLLFGGIPDFAWAGINFDFDGDLRGQGALFNNYDMDYETRTLNLEADTRARLSLDISNSSPFSLHSLLEIGNVDLDSFEFSELGPELREMYLGYDGFMLKGKIGIIDIKTPGGLVYEDDNVGFQLKFTFNNWDLRAFYVSPTLLDDSLKVAEEMSDISHLLYVGGSFEKLAEWDIWAMGLYDNSDDDFHYFSAWTGLEVKKKLDKLTLKGGATYNFGSVTQLKIPLSAYYGHLEAEYRPEKNWSIFTRYNLTSGNNGSNDNLNQFQVVEGEGHLNTSLGLLFGGGAFSSQSYFSSESISIVDDNLSSGDIVFNDPGLFTYEFGTTCKFKDLPFPVTTELVLGGAHTGELFSREGFFYSLFGWEVDVHNKIEITKDLDLFLSFAYLLPGNSFKGIYELNGGDILDLDTSFMAAFKIIYSF